jgi:hypothetical protein
VSSLIRALAVEMHENWLEAHHYLNMDDLPEHQKEVLHGGVMQAILPCGQRCALPTRAHHRHHGPICRRFWTQLSADTNTSFVGLVAWRAVADDPHALQARRCQMLAVRNGDGV